MKNIIGLNIALIALVLSCGTTKEIEAPEKKEVVEKVTNENWFTPSNPYLQKIHPGQEGAPTSMILVIPFLENGDQLEGSADSVIFRGNVEKIGMSKMEGVFVLRCFYKDIDQLTPAKSKVNLKLDEAMVFYTLNGESKTMRIEGIKEKPAMYMP